MTQNEIIEMARQAGLWPAVTDIFLKELKDFAKLAAQHEREACAKVCENYGRAEEMQAIGNDFAEQILARGQA